MIVNQTKILNKIKSPILLLILCSFFIFNLRSLNLGSTGQPPLKSHKQRLLFQNAFNRFGDVLAISKFEGPSVKHGTRASLTFESVHNALNEQKLKFYESYISEKVVATLKMAHMYVVSAIPETVRPDLYTGSGYVMLGGDEEDWNALLTIKKLRKTGSMYPIEVFIPPNRQRDNFLCDDIFPSLMAKCVLLTDIFGKNTLLKYQHTTEVFRILAVLGSSFKKVMYLDTNILPLHNPENIFTSEVFQNFGMILWPTFYRNSISPTYYEVAGIKIENHPVRILNDRFTDISYYQKFIDTYTDNPGSNNFHDMKGTLAESSSTESIFMVDKYFHFDTLLLSLFYANEDSNSYGSLINIAKNKHQGNRLALAAHYFKKKYYQLYKSPDRIETEGEVDRVIAHYDASEDYKILQSNVLQTQIMLDNNEPYSYMNFYKSPWSIRTCTPMFFQIEKDDLNPFKLSKTDIYEGSNGDKRIFGKHIKIYNTDFELEIFELINDIICKDKTKLKIFNENDFTSVCKEFLTKRIQFLKGSSNTFWEKYLYEKRSVNPVSIDMKSHVQNIINQGFARDMDFSLKAVKRNKKIFRI
ncbi:hypothetical protein DAMA08_037260 [Martiniozyma asiatica (nom. inval.)]|nr:hypothetical protein DAMA08_037260 [Martiniozyma asiatica]